MAAPTFTARLRHAPFGIALRDIFPADVLDLRLTGAVELDGHLI